MAEYPNITCGLPGHERPEPGYAVCCHVLNGQSPVADVERATMKSIGTITCAECFKTRTLDLDTTVCVCAHCAAIEGWISEELN